MNGKIIKDALILFLITVIAGLGLGAVYGITKAPIEKANYNIQQNAYRTVFPDADAFNDMDGFDSEKATEAAAAAGYADDTIENCVVAVDASGAELGYVISVTDPNSYGGDVTLSIGVTNDGTLNGYSITTINDTAGLGMKAKEPAFYEQYVGKNPTKFAVSKDGGDGEQIDALSGATITSRAVTGAVNAALGYYQNAFGQGGN